MAYEKKTWKNRQSEYPNRRTLTPVDGQENTYDVARAEGLVMEEGDAFDQDSMNDLEDRIGAGFVDSGVNVYTHTKTGTVHNFAGQGANGRALMTADVAAGDTFTVNGTPVAAYMGAESAVDMMAGSAYSGRWVSFVVDSEEATLNFKGGGGKVTVSGLSAGVVKSGTTVTVKQGTKTVSSVTGSYTPTFRTQVVSQTINFGKYQWATFKIQLPTGTVGISTYDNGGGNATGVHHTKIQDGYFYSNVWHADQSGNTTVTVTAVICTDLE